MNKMVAILSAIVAISVAAIIVYVGTIEEQPDTAERETLAGTEKEPLTFEQQILKQRIDAGFEPADCQTVSVQKFGELYYDGPLIDTHWHIASIPDSSPYAEEDDLYKTQPVLGQSVRVTDIICTLEQENVTKVFAFFPVYKEIRDQQVEVVRRTIELYPDTFVPFLMPPDNDGSADGFPTVNSEVLNDMLEIQPGLFEGYGEIGLYARNGGAPELLPDSQRLQEIYPVVREHGLTVYFHLGEGHKESFERILDENPDINFIWHGDQLISYVGNHQDLSEIEEILYNHPNVYYGVDELYGDVWLLRPAATKQEFLDRICAEWGVVSQRWGGMEEVADAVGLACHVAGQPADGGGPHDHGHHRQQHRQPEVAQQLPGEGERLVVRLVGELEEHRHQHHERPEQPQQQRAAAIKQAAQADRGERQDHRRTR